MERQTLIAGIKSMTCPTIRDELKARNLKSSGVKAVIQQRLIDSLPPEKEEDHSICPICREDLASVDAKMTTPCGHTFCTGCLLKWGATGDDSCPCCRAVIPDFGTEGASEGELESAFSDGERAGFDRGFRRGKRDGFNQANANADELLENMSSSHTSEIDKLKSQHLKQLTQIHSNCQELMVTKEEFEIAVSLRCAESTRREQIELELRVANNRLSQFEELASQITGSVSSHNLSGFNPMNSMITRIR
ncbi:hypothetical protein N8751_01440 [bacterium]|nr:hypothetical protein [bacterium]